MEKIQDAWHSTPANLTTGGMYGPPSGGGGNSDSRFRGFSYPSPGQIALLAKQHRQGGGGGRGRKGNGRRGGGKKGGKKGEEEWQSALGGFYPVVSSGTREMAFVHAISSAGVAHALTRACSSGELENCGCDRSLRGMSPEGFQVSVRKQTR